MSDYAIVFTPLTRVFTQFFGTCLVRDDGSEMPHTELHALFYTWHLHELGCEADRTTWTPTRLTRTMRLLEVPSRMSNGTRRFVGVRPR